MKGVNIMPTNTGNIGQHKRSPVGSNTTGNANWKYNTTGNANWKCNTTSNADWKYTVTNKQTTDNNKDLSKWRFAVANSNYRNGEKK